MSEVLNKIKMMSYKDAESNDLARACEVTVRKDRECFICNKVIKAGSKAISASHMVDKLYNVTVKELLNNDFVDQSNFKFVPVRHWVCTCCASDIVSRYYTKRSRCYLNRKHTKTNKLEELYKKGEITAKEWDDIEMAEIHQYAFEDAVGIGQD